MKKIAIIALTLISILSLPVIFSFADDNPPAPAPPAEQAPSVPQSGQPLPQLVNLGSAQNEGQIRDLEKRIDDLEREVHSQDERVRSMERTVNDLRRAR